MRSKHRPHVLCVDHHEDSRVMLSALLALARVDAVTVGTAVQALSLVRAERFDLVVLDACLPRIDGFELCRRLREIEPQVPILFFSSGAYEADKKRGIKAGATAYVVKPDIAGLLRNVRHFASLAARPTGKQAGPLRRKVKNISPPSITKQSNLHL